MTLAYADQGDTGAQVAADAAAHGVALEVVCHPAARRGFVLLPRRWMVEWSFAWMARFRRVARDRERTKHVLAGWHWVAFVSLLLHRLAPILDEVHNRLQDRRANGVEARERLGGAHRPMAVEAGGDAAGRLGLDPPAFGANGEGDLPDVEGRPLVSEVQRSGVGAAPP